MRRRDRRGGQPRHRRGQHDRHHRPEPARHHLRRAAQPRKHRHQSRCRGKGHLESRAQQGLGPQDQHDHRRNRHRAQADRAPVEQHGRQGHGNHDKGAFRRHVATRQRQIARRRNKRGKGRDLAPRHPQRHHRHRRQRQPHGAKDETGQQPHVQPRDRQQMRKVGVTQRLLGRFAHAGPVAGGDGGGKGPDLSGQRRLNRPRQAHAQGKDRLPAIGLCAHHQRHPGIAHRTDPEKPGVAAKVETAGLDRALGRRQMAGGHHPQAGARHRPRRPVQGDSHPGRHLAHPMQPHPVQRQPQSARGRPVHADNTALDRAIVAKIQNRCGHRLCPGAGKRHPGRNQTGSKKAGPEQWPGLPRSQERRHGAAGKRDQRPDRRLLAKRKVPPDAQSKHHRRPWHQRAPLTEDPLTDCLPHPHACSRPLRRVIRPQAIPPWLSKG